MNAYNDDNAIRFSGEAQYVEWSKIQTPTDEVVVPYESLVPPPDGNKSKFVVDLQCIISAQVS